MTECRVYRTEDRTGYRTEDRTEDRTDDRAEDRTEDRSRLHLSHNPLSIISACVTLLYILDIAICNNSRTTRSC